MSSRTPAGVSARSDLFTSRSEGKSHDYDGNSMGSESKYEPTKEDDDDANPLQLEHMLGFAGDYHGTVNAIPFDENIYIKSVGSLITVENLSDPHGQSFHRGHDMPVCSMTVSRSGRYVASGQLGTKFHKGNAAPVFLWDTKAMRRISVLRGLSTKASMLAFSWDDKFLCGCDEENLFYIWDLSTTEVVFGQQLLSPASVLKWVDQKKESHYINYELVVGIGPNLTQGLFAYDPMRAQWGMKWRNYQMPPNGALVRTYTCVDISLDAVFIYVGTTVGEIAIFRRDTVVFRGCVPICSNGLHSIVTLPDDTLVCGGGDGFLYKVSGRDMKWNVNLEAKVDHGVINSISLSANRSEIIVSSSSGRIYRALTANLDLSTVSVSNTTGVRCIAFPLKAGPAGEGIYFTTGTSTGELRAWDLNDYACLSTVKFTKSGCVNCVAMVGNNTILSGWEDGGIQCTDSTGRSLWCIPTAHRDGTTSLSVHVDSNLQYFVSGGSDGAVRVWKFANRELIFQYTEHRRGVAKVLIDAKNPNIVHSVGGDCSILSFDLQAGRRIISHLSNSGTIHSMTQRLDSKLELVTCDSLGQLQNWDIYYREPVMVIHDPSKCIIRDCMTSPSGRFLAFVGDDFLLKVLDSKTSKMVAVGAIHSSPVSCVCWTPDERQIVTGAEDSSLCIWNFFLGGEDI